MSTVLLVEDEELERRYLKSLLEKSSYDFQIIGEACNGREAIELCSKLNPDIIFMDIKMPGIDGLAATEIIKKSNPQVRILLLSAYDDFNYARQAIKLGVSEYLLKPAQPDEILAALNSLTQENSVKLLNFNSYLLQADQQDFINSKYPLDKEKEIILALQKRDCGLLKVALDELIKKLLADCQTVSTLKIRLYELIIVTSRVLNDSGYSDQEVRSFKLAKFQDIANITTMDELKEHLVAFKNDFLQLVNFNEIDSNEYVERLVAYIKAHKADNISLGDIAAYFHFSPCHVSRLLKRKTGLTYPQYLNKIRLAEAKELLRNSNLEISKIASIVGYQEIPHFNRIFKKTLGLSPSKYRNLFNDGKEKTSA